MIETVGIIDIEDSDLTEVAVHGNMPVYGQVDGICLYKSWGRKELSETDCLYGQSVNGKRKVMIRKFDATPPFQGVLTLIETHIDADGVTTEDIVTMTANTIPELLFQMNRKIELLRQALTDPVR